MAGAKEIRAGKAYIELTSVNNIQKGLNAAKKQLQDFGKSVAAIGAKIAGIGTAVLGLGGVAVSQFMSMGDQLDKMSQRTGLTVEELSELKFACQQSGASVEDLEAAVKGMNKGFAEAKRGEGEFLKGLKMLGLTVKDVEKMTVAERFQFLSDKITGVVDPAQKAKLAMLFFTEAGTKLLPLVGSIRELREEAQKLGLTISGDSAKAAAELTDAWGRLTAMFKVFVFEVGAALAPMLKEIADSVKVVATAILNWIKENKDVVVSIAKVAAIVVGVGTAILAVGGIITAVGAVFGALSTIIAAFGTVCSIVGALITGIGSAIMFLISPIGLAIAAVVGLGGAVLYYTGAM